MLVGLPLHLSLWELIMEQYIALPRVIEICESLGCPISRNTFWNFRKRNLFPLPSLTDNEKSINIYERDRAIELIKWWLKRRGVIALENEVENLVDNNLLKVN